MVQPILTLWPVLTRVKSGQAQFDAGQNGPRSQVGLEHSHSGTSSPPSICSLCIVIVNFDTSIDNCRLIFKIRSRVNFDNEGNTYNNFNESFKLENYKLKKDEDNNMRL